MDNLSRGILGGIAGGFRAKEEIIDDNIESRRDQAKQRALLKRQKNLARFQNDLAMSRQESSWAHQEDVREDEKAFKLGQKGSGYVLNGRELTKDELENIPVTERDNLKTIAEQQKELGAQKAASEKDMFQFKERVKAQYKDLSAKDRERIAENARADVKSFLLSQGAQQGIEDSDSFDLEIGKDKKKRDRILKALDESGFNFNVAQEEDRLRIYLGGFDPDEMGSKYSEKSSSKDQGNTFDQLLNKIKVSGRDDIPDRDVQDNSGVVSTKPVDNENDRRSNVEQTDENVPARFVGYDDEGNPKYQEGIASPRSLDYTKIPGVEWLMNQIEETTKQRSTRRVE